MDQYIQKYGDNAIQAYKKSLRHSESLQKDQPSPIKQQLHLLPKKSLSKRSLKSHISKRNDSQSRLVHSKSIKSSQKFQDEPRKKGSSFIDGSKRTVVTNPVNGFGHTFSKLGFSTNQNKKKLVITQVNTPKCSTPKMQINLNLHNQRQSNEQKQSNACQSEIRDKLTERIQRSSGKKPGDKCATSQSKHNTKRSFLGGIQSRLQDLLITSKYTLKSMGSVIRQCVDIILMNQQEIKLRKVFMLIKQIFEKSCEMGEKYKSKLSRALQKIHSMEIVHQTYLMNSSNVELHKRTKTKLEASGSKSGKKGLSIEAIIMNENYELRRKVNKLEKQLEYYTSQNASLNNVFGKYKNSESQLRFNSVNQQIDQKQQQNEMYRQFYHQHQNQPNYHKLQNQQKSLSKQQQVGYSNNKLQKRRSSENLYSNNLTNEHGFSYAIEKRLSFDPALLQPGSDIKKKLGANSNSKFGSNSNSNSQYNSIGFVMGPNTMHNSIRSCQNNDEMQYHDDHEGRRLNHGHHEVQELSEEEDSQYQ